MMSRRRFVQNASLITAGSAIACSFIGCNSEFVIPCLGAANPLVLVPGMTYIRASELGCVLDCNLANGRNKHTGGEATDDAPLINAAMAAAAPDHPITLIIDGAALISGLFLPAAGHWSIAGLGCGTGFFVKTGTNNDGIHNGPPDAAAIFDPGPPVPPRGMNVSLTNFTLNGNQGNGSNGNSTSGIRQGSKVVWYCGINLMDLDNIILENLVIVNTPAYHVRLTNVGNITATGCVLKSKGLSTDGFHFDGPANDITISKCNFTTGDDSIALNCPEGHYGNISRVTVTDCTFNSLSLMRLYTAIGSGINFYIDSVSVTNCTGTFSEAAFLIGLANGSFPNSVASLSVSDCRLSALTVLAVAENFGSIALRNVTFAPFRSNDVFWLGPQSSRLCAFLRPSPLYSTETYVGSSLSFENCTIQRASDIDVAAIILENNSRIDKVSFNGFTVQNPSQYSRARDLLVIGRGSIGQLTIDSLDRAHIELPVSEGGFSSIGSVSGAGVLQTGWAFPDAAMANGVPYISANSGQPSIKVGGVVEHFPQP